MTAPGRESADVTVVVPAYQVQAVIDAALASVAGQRLAPLHVVVVDDGSDDGTAEAARRWESVLPISVIEQRNAGPAAARRAAIGATDTSLIALLDADDVWLPDHLSVMVATHRQSGGLISSDCLPWHPDRPLPVDTYRARRPVPPPTRQRVEILRENFVFVGALFSRGDYQAAGGFRDGYTAAEDWDLWIRMIRLGVVVSAAPGPTVLYRIVEGSLTRRIEVYDAYLAVVEAAREGCSSEEERTTLERRLAWLSARRSLAMAYQAARSGDRRTLWRHATRAWRGSPRMAIEAAALLAAPRHAARLGDRARAAAVR